MEEAPRVQGRQIGPAELEQVRGLLAVHPQWSRRRLSQELAVLWGWRNGAGQLKDMAARSLLLKLEQRGWIVLPPRRQKPSNRMLHKAVPALCLSAQTPSLLPSLKALQPLAITEVSGEASGRELFDGLLHRYHYLSHRSSVGENLQYLVCDLGATPLACVLFGAAAWHCADRDGYIGWEAQSRMENLHLVANNTRFLILRRTPHLASHILGRIARRLSQDWQRKYGHAIYLLETFVQCPPFTGLCYRAANWIRVGQTKGRTRQDRADGTRHQVPLKDIYLCPLHPRFRERLQGKDSLTPQKNHHSL